MSMPFLAKCEGRGRTVYLAMEDARRQLRAFFEPTQQLNQLQYSYGTAEPVEIQLDGQVVSWTLPVTAKLTYMPEKPPEVKS